MPRAHSCAGNAPHGIVGAAVRAPAKPNRDRQGAAENAAPASPLLAPPQGWKCFYRPADSTAFSALNSRFSNATVNNSPSAVRTAFHSTTQPTSAVSYAAPTPTPRTLRNRNAPPRSARTPRTAAAMPSASSPQSFNCPARVA